MRRYVLKKEKRKQQLIAAGILLLILLLVIFGISRIVNSGEYHNERTFDKYAKAYDKQYRKQQDKDCKNSTVTYGKPFSTAVNVPMLGKKFQTKEMTRTYQDDVRRFEKKYANLTEKDRAAFLLSYEQFDSPKKVVSVALHEETYLKKKGEKETTSAGTVRTFNYAKKTGLQLTPNQVFKGDYLHVLADKTKAALEGEYDSVDEKAVKGEQALFDNYVLTEDGVTFYFAPGTVCDKSEGTVSAEVSYDDLKGCIREDIGKRVIDPKKPMVAITYDDGPHEKWTEKILNVYQKYNSVCTFFELGKNVEETKDASKILKRELDLGCEVGTHSYGHPDLLSLGNKQIKKEAERSKAAIRKACGQDPTVFRGPYGNSSQKVAKIFGLPEYNWNVDTLDWQSKNKNAIVRHVKSMKHLDGDIVLMHSIYGSSARATAEIVPWLIDQGYQLVTVSELMEYKYGKDPKKVVNYGYTFAN